MKNTKIVCTMGPSTLNVDVFKGMINAGMDVVRINLSHAKGAQIDEVLKLVSMYPSVGVMFDTRGPELRIINKDELNIEVKRDDIIRISKDKNNGIFSLNYPDVIDNFRVGNILEIDDGLIEAEVIKCHEEYVELKVLSDGVIKNNKGVYVPGVMVNIPFLSEKDYEDIITAIESGATYLALSFVTCKEDVLEVKKILQEHNSDIKVLAKIENKMAMDNLDEILSVSDGVMVARGDLGTEVSMSLIPVYQKQIIKSAKVWSKPVIVATEMLESMKYNLRPTRAEVSDVANAVIDGADAVMLSGETSVGKHPVEAVEFMSKVLRDTEKFNLNEVEGYNGVDVTKEILSCAVSISKSIGAKVIVTNTNSGDSVRVLSKFRADCPVLAICSDEHVAKSLSINYGVVSVVDSNNNLEADMIYKAKRFFNLDVGDKIIVVGYKSECGIDDYLSVQSI